jgi:hypothetical protein
MTLNNTTWKKHHVRFPANGNSKIHSVEEKTVFSSNFLLIDIMNYMVNKIKLSSPILLWCYWGCGEKDEQPIDNRGVLGELQEDRQKTSPH